MTTKKKPGRPAKSALKELKELKEPTNDAKRRQEAEVINSSVEVEDLKKSLELQKEEYAKLLDSYTNLLSVFKNLEKKEVEELTSVVMKVYLGSNNIPLRTKIKKLHVMLENLQKFL